MSHRAATGPAVARAPGRPHRARRASAAFGLAGLALAAAGCDALPDAPLRPAPAAGPATGYVYRVAPGDTLDIVVWHDADLSRRTTVRPDGRIALPLIEEVEAAGQTPAELGRAIERRLEVFVREPHVIVILADAAGPLDRSVRVVGAATAPRSIVYRPDLTLLDAVIAAGGLTATADGNRAVLVRHQGDRPTRFRARLADLLRKGDVTANAGLLPGDVLVIPETVF